MWVVMVHHKTSDQYLTSGKVSTRFIQRFMKYRLLKTFNQKRLTFCNVDAMVTAIPVLLYRRANYIISFIPQTASEELIFEKKFSHILPFGCDGNQSN